MKFFITRFVFLSMYRFLYLFFSLLLIFLHFCESIPSNIFKGIECISLLTPFVIGVNIFLIIYALLGSEKKILLPLTSLYICYSSVEKFYFLNLDSLKNNFTNTSLDHRNKNLNSKNKLRLLTFNSLSFNRYKVEPREQFESEFITYIQQKQPDVIGFQETYIKEKSLLKKLYPYGVYKNPSTPNERITYPIVSKYPILNKGRVINNTSKKITKPLDVYYADIDIKGHVFRFYNIHLQSFHINTNTDFLLNNYETSILQLNKTFIYQEKEIYILKKHILNSPYPCILLGDLNNTPFSHVYHELTEDLGLKDTFLCKGQNTHFGATYNKPWFYPLRIDHILVPENSKLITYEIHKTSNWSDHYPVFAEILF